MGPYEASGFHVCRLFLLHLVSRLQQAASVERFGTGFQSTTLIVGGQPENHGARA